MKYSVKRVGLIFAISLSLLTSVGCSKEVDKVGVQPAEIAPNESTENATPNASAVKSDITKEQQSKEMPLPGQANDHSTLDPVATQKNHKP
ncbi:hypothetical protein [Polynucleobacter sp. AP-Reno-20A-A9]|uniref:hypothetical protein n=1 Tax=Polynucleobacter sp. AP-Reno-20A-A9 TaxID=2576925 RepID=UPI001C0CC498|nr:hypothetical protein [Polynucleobacter sp. AP-Reno-20A-A9]MBU3628592.1 hypothetical protein [Polynucleobacter sp. AP-Reno-20A-A9]